MTEPSIEEAYRALDLVGMQHEERALVKQLALVVLREYVKRVNREAERDQLRGNPLEGAHYRAIQKVAAATEQRILALGGEHA